MNTILTMFTIGLPVYDTWHNGFCKFAMIPCFFLFFFFFFEKHRMAAALTLLISQPVMASTILDTSNTRRNIWYQQASPYTTTHQHQKNA